MTASTGVTDLCRAREMVARAHAGERVAGVERLEDGLTNAVYRVTVIESGESRLRRRAIDLAALDSRRALVHGDASGRNVLVRAVNDRWQVAALLDWEHAFLGSALWDVGSLLWSRSSTAPRICRGVSGSVRT